MTKDSHLSIWFFVGILLTFYGLIIVGAGIYGLFVPPPRALRSLTPTSGGGRSCWRSASSTAITSRLKSWDRREGRTYNPKLGGER